MNQPIVECVPNFSEARRPDVVDAIANAILSVTGAVILDRSSDNDHNRSVITFAGFPNAVEEAAFQAIKTAALLIDLNHHSGEHPRIGATDVVPFVPIKGLTMQDCVQMARRLGERVGKELNIPVYLYEEAASRPDRKNLEDIRRGQYEALKEEIKTNPNRFPDFGPAELGPAGATVIGARAPLIAFNAFLSTSDVTIAQKVARAIRFSSGGLRYVKALGMYVNGLAQVSMNLTNYKATPIARVIEAIRSEAARYGTTIHHCELIGLIPEDALIDMSVWYSQLDGFNRDQILEHRLSQVLEKNISTRESFIDDLANDSPTPGGGAAAAYCGAMAAALAEMVGKITLKKKKYQSVHSQMETIIDKSKEMSQNLTSMVDEDSKSFQEVLRTSKLNDTNTDQKQKMYQQALLGAVNIPLKVAHQAVDTMTLLLDLAKEGSLVALSDTASAFAIARASFTGAHLNIQTNLKEITDPSIKQNILDQLFELEKRKDQIEVKIKETLLERDNLRLL